MKKLLSLALLLISALVTAQDINQYEYAIVPVKFDWMNRDNQYRVSTLTKMKLTELGFKVFYTSDILPANIAANRCLALTVDVERNNSVLSTRLGLVLRNCQNEVVFKGALGSSKAKDFEQSYREALTDAFKSLEAQQYHFTGVAAPVAPKAPEPASVPTTAPVVPANATATPSNGLTLEPTATGYLVIDPGTSVMKFKLSRTSSPDVYLATSQGRQGVLVRKGNVWYFDCYQQDKLISEATTIQIQ